MSQAPPRQKPVQQSALVVQAPATGAQSGGGGWHVPPTQPKLQQSAFWVQADPFGTHVVRHTRLPSTVLHSPRQQSALVTQATPCGRQVVGPKSQRSVILVADLAAAAPGAAGAIFAGRTAVPVGFVDRAFAAALIADVRAAFRVRRARFSFDDAQTSAAFSTEAAERAAIERLFAGGPVRTAETRTAPFGHAGHRLATSAAAFGGGITDGVRRGDTLRTRCISRRRTSANNTGPGGYKRAAAAKQPPLVPAVPPAPLPTVPALPDAAPVPDAPALPPGVPPSRAAPEPLRLTKASSRVRAATRAQSEGPERRGSERQRAQTEGKGTILPNDTIAAHQLESHRPRQKQAALRPACSSPLRLLEFGGEYSARGRGLRGSSHAH